ncbi:MAG: deoxyguanosinetriphosphate triphosphohydrolase [Chloroflexota bacterium]|nr:deoxyguanosinetriphosphate triphosphohydrolase [Chloroflexota bacterium]|tara:strand:+ start:686 stop:1780 length:1095 start_codon:yes stop_codon:yes gene_type:complete
MIPKDMQIDLNSVRRRLERKEESLSSYATRSMGAVRQITELPSATRTEFQRDRDRVIHANSFRRLKHKSQVFVAPQGDHFTTRLTHVIEVSQVGRSIARGLNLNEDLVEAIGLGHDLGHTPFGHIGESVLNQVLSGGFHHSRHSVRLITQLEKDGKGLNLTEDVIEGIRHHSKPEGKFLSRDAVGNLSLEAQIVRISDALAYLAHDILDALRSNFIRLEDLPSEAVGALGVRHSQRVSTVIENVIESSWDCSGEVDLPDDEKPWIRMSPELGKIVTDLRVFMFENFYHPISASMEGRKAAAIVGVLFEHFKSNPDLMPDWLRDISGSSERAAADYVCGMTDNYALIIAEQIKPGLSDGVFQGRI